MNIYELAKALNIITIDDVDEILGRISYDTTFEIAECILNSDTESALKLLNEIHEIYL